MKSLSSISLQGTFMNVIKCLNRLLNCRENCYSLLQSDSLLVCLVFSSISLSACMLSCVWLFATPWGCSPQGFSVHGISQARILEWVAISYSRGSSWPKDQTHVSLSPVLTRTTWESLFSGISSVYFSLSLGYFPVS